jgi:hypothetical protein
LIPPYLGLVCGVLYSVGGLVYDMLTIGLNWGTAMAFMALVGMPVAFGTFGFICGALIAFVAGGVGAVLWKGDTIRQARAKKKPRLAS